jgi:hypothetical protein
MAQTHNAEREAAKQEMYGVAQRADDIAEIKAALPADDSLYMSVSGYIGVVPWRTLSADPEMNILANKGVARVLITSGQALVDKLVKEGKSHAEIVAELNKLFASGKVGTRGEMQTVGAKRTEIATRLMTEALAKAGKTVNQATFDHLLTGYANKARDRIDAELRTWLGTYVKPTGKTAKPSAGAIDADVSIDDLV